MIIYSIKNKINGKEYIGKTESSFKSRYGVNWNKSISNDYLRKSIDKHGIGNFEIAIIGSAKSSEELNLLEIELIKSRGSVYPHGYNFGLGGEGGKHCEDTKARISKRMKEIPLHHRGKYLKGITLACKICGKELYTYLSRGLPNNLTCSNKCRMMTYGRPVEGTSIKDGSKIYFEKVSKAVESGFLDSKISASVHARIKSHKGYTWRYL